MLFMVLYHWLNYFIGVGYPFYKYLRFLTPSFIFITGFVISNIYLAKYTLESPKLPRRLLQRGAKILAVFVALNVAASVLRPVSANGRKLFQDWKLADVITSYITGNVVSEGSGKAAAFYILLPIGYLLLLSAGLLIVSRYYKYAFQVAFLLSVGGIVALAVYDLDSANLELLAIGLLGVLCGYVPARRLNSVVKRFYAIGLAYLCYTIAITVAPAVYYPLQVVGVCLTLALLYMMGTSSQEPGSLRRHVILLGKYSLFAYIAQIVLIQLLHVGIPRLTPQHVVVAAIGFVGAFGLTMVSVEALHWARAKEPLLNRVYSAVFS